MLVTRPGKSGELLTQQIIEAGGQAIHLPTITFESLINTPPFLATLETLDQQDWLIFTSQEAVLTSLPTIQKRWPHLFYRIRLAAIGASTAQLLQKMTQQTVIFPEKQWNTEGLLELPAMQAIAQQKIILIKGAGGRAALRETLIERGAEVSQFNVYERILPSIDTKPYIHLIKQGKINIIIASSVESLINLKPLLGEAVWPPLTAIPLMVMSERIKLVAQHLGFQTIWVAENGDYIQTLATLV